MKSSHSKVLQPTESLDFDSVIGDDTWIEVVQQMDIIYRDLVESQIELEQKNTELEEAQQFIESILSAMHNILVVTDTNSRILRVNAALEALTGKTSIELSGQLLTSVFYQSQSNIDLSEKLIKKIRSGMLLDCEIEIVNANDESVPMSITSKAHYDYSGRLIG